MQRTPSLTRKRSCPPIKFSTFHLSPPSTHDNGQDKDPALSKIQDSLVASRRPQDDIPQPYRKCWDELSVEQGCLLKGSRVVVPPNVCKAVIIKVLHEGHQGGTRMKALARSFVWWPGIDKWEFFSAPCERLHAAFADPFMNKMFLTVVDVHSKWLEVLPTSTTTA